VRSELVAIAGAIALVPGLTAQERVTVSVELSAASVPEAYVTLSGLIADDRFVSAMESGFPLHVTFTVELRQPRSLWDRTVDRADWEYVVLWDPVRERFVLEDPAGTEVLPGRAQLQDRLEQVHLVGLEPNGTGEFYYSAIVEARTLDDEDVDEVYEWLRGESADSLRREPDSLRRERPGFVTRTARSLLVRIAPLPRVTVEGKSRRFQRP
jgi:hypothetical protein